MMMRGNNALDHHIPAFRNWKGMGHMSAMKEPFFAAYFACIFRISRFRMESIHAIVYFCVHHNNSYVSCGTAMLIDIGLSAIGERSQLPSAGNRICNKDVMKELLNDDDDGRTTALPSLSDLLAYCTVTKYLFNLYRFPSVHLLIQPPR